MAEAINLGASVLAFITIAAQLSKTAATIYGSIHDAPEDIKRFHTRLHDLKFTLETIHWIQTRHLGCDEDLRVREFWNEKFQKLQRDFSELEQFTRELDEKGMGVKGRIRWFLSSQERAKKILVLVSEDVELLKTLQRIMEL
jgi:hypothetical protein